MTNDRQIYLYWSERKSQTLKGRNPGYGITPFQAVRRGATRFAGCFALTITEYQNSSTTKLPAVKSLIASVKMAKCSDELCALNAASSLYSS